MTNTPDDTRATPQEWAAVDQSAETRDPADDSGELDDPTALADTYESFPSVAEAQQAIVTERHSPDSPREDDRSTDNERDNQMGLTTESEQN